MHTTIHKIDLNFNNLRNVDKAFAIVVISIYNRTVARSSSGRLLKILTKFNIKTYDTLAILNDDAINQRFPGGSNDIADIKHIYNRTRKVVEEMESNTRKGIKYLNTFNKRWKDYYEKISNA